MASPNASLTCFGVPNNDSGRSRFLRYAEPYGSAHRSKSPRPRFLNFHCFPSRDAKQTGWCPCENPPILTSNPEFSGSVSGPSCPPTWYLPMCAVAYPFSFSDSAIVIASAPTSSCCGGPLNFAFSFEIPPRPFRFKFPTT